MALEILYEDDAIAVVNKPAGVYVHPSPGHERGTLTEQLVRRYPEMARVGSVERPGVVHRLDADTSGVMVFARTQAAYLALRRQFESHREVGKTYLAVLHGVPRREDCRVEKPVGRMSWDAKRMAVVPEAAGGKRAVTQFTVLGKRNGLALTEAIIETGRTHQIRVHAAAIGHPIAGDALYGDPAKDLRLRHRPSRTLLHAVTLAFEHPVTRRRVSFSAVPPADIVHACD